MTEPSTKEFADSLSVAQPKDPFLREHRRPLGFVRGTHRLLGFRGGGRQHFPGALQLLFNTPEPGTELSRLLHEFRDPGPCLVRLVLQVPGSLGRLGLCGLRFRQGGFGFVQRGR
jgi:hypothetical protein